MYKLTDVNVIIRLADNASIPKDISNKDYVAYLSWLEEGNEPEAADPLPEPVELTPQEKLANAGLTIDELKTLLGLK